METTVLKKTLERGDGGWGKESLPRNIKINQVIWAEKYYETKYANPYRFDDDMGGNPQGTINDFSIVLDSTQYFTSIISKPHGLFYQQSVELRRKALLGIIVSDTNPARLKLRPMRFNLTPENLDEVIARLKQVGYFQE